MDVMLGPSRKTGQFAFAVRKRSLLDSLSMFNGPERPPDGHAHRDDRVNEKGGEDLSDATRLGIIRRPNA
jgi:hypothetical protein